MKRIIAGAAAALAVAALSCSEPSQKPVAVPADAIPAGTRLGGGSISGRVIYSGAPVKPQPIDMGSDATCRHSQDGEPQKEELVVGSEGGLKYAFVHVSAGQPPHPFAPPADPVDLDQKGCAYRPHVVGIQVGQPLRLINSDPTLHNVHTVSQANKPFNFGMSVQGQKTTRYFAEPEVMIKAKCDVHPWMASYIGVVSNPWFAVTEGTGRFELKEMPAGDYVIEVWHETLGVKKQNVTLGDGEKKDISFSYPE